MEIRYAVLNSVSKVLIINLTNVVIANIIQQLVLEYLFISIFDLETLLNVAEPREENIKTGNRWLVDV